MQRSRKPQRPAQARRGDPVCRKKEHTPTLAETGCSVSSLIFNPLLPMNSDLLEKPIVLSLNRAWQVIGHRTVKQALIALNGGSAGLPPAMGLDIAYPKLEDDSWNFDRPLYLNPVAWDEWIKLPVREFDFVVSTPKLRIRV